MRPSSTSGMPRLGPSAVSIRASCRSASGSSTHSVAITLGLLLLADGIEKTIEFAPVCLGIDTGRLAAESQAAHDHLRELGPERLGEFDFATVPRVQFVTTNGPPCTTHETEGS